MAAYPATWKASRAMDLLCGRAHGDSLWSRLRPEERLRWRGQQYPDLFYLFRSAAIRSGTWLRRLCAPLAGCLVPKHFIRAGWPVDEHKGALRARRLQKRMNSEFKDLNARYERLNALYHVGHVIHSTLDPQEALNLILKEAVRLMRASSGSAVLVNPTTGFLEILASQGLPDKAAELKLRVGEGITGWVAQTGKPARVGDVELDRRYVMVRTDVRSELAVPLEVNGELRGVINVDSERRDAFNADDQELLEGLAVQAARVIQNTWLYEQLRLKVGLFETLASVSQTINSTLNLDDALKVITHEACDLMRAKMCSLML